MSGAGALAGSGLGSWRLSLCIGGVIAASAIATLLVVMRCAVTGVCQIVRVDVSGLVLDARRHQGVAGALIYWAADARGRTSATWTSVPRLDRLRGASAITDENGFFSFTCYTTWCAPKPTGILPADEGVPVGYGRELVRVEHEHYAAVEVPIANAEWRCEGVEGGTVRVVVEYPIIVLLKR